LSQPFPISDFYNNDSKLPHRTGGIPQGNAVVNPVTNFGSGRQLRSNFELQPLSGSQHVLKSRFHSFGDGISEDLADCLAQMGIGRDTIDFDESLVDGLIP